MRIRCRVERIQSISKSLPGWTSVQQRRFENTEKRIAALDEKLNQELRSVQKLAVDEARYDFYERTWAAVDARARVAERAREHDEEIQEAKEREAHVREKNGGGGGS